MKDISERFVGLNDVAFSNFTGSGGKVIQINAGAAKLEAGQDLRTTAAPTFASLTVNGATVINENGGDADFRVESDTDVNALYVDASANTVQVGSATTADSAKFYVSGKVSASGDINTNGGFKVDDTQVVTNQQTAIASLTDNSTGTPAAELVDTTTLGVCDPAKTNANFASLNAKFDALLTRIRTHGLIAT